MYNFKPIKSTKTLKQLNDNYNLEYLLLLEEDIENLYLIEKDNCPCAIIELDFQVKSIQWFEIFSPYRRQGIGKQIIQALTSELEQTDLDCIYATPMNYEVEQFWHKCGFVDFSHPLHIYRLK